MLGWLRRARPLQCAALLLALAAPARAQDQAAVHGGPVRALAVAPEGGSLASAGFDQSVIFWDLASGRARAVVRWHGGAVNALAPLTDGGVVSGGEDGRIAIWSREGGLQRALLGHHGPVAGLAARGGVIASASWDGTVRVWAADGTARVLDGHRGNVNAVVFRADGMPVSAGFDGTVRAWRRDGLGEVIAAFGLPQNALAALPDGGLAAGGADGTVRVISLAGVVRDVLTLGRPVVALAVNGSGSLLAAGSLGGNVAVLALPEGRLLHTLEGPGTPVWSAAFDSDGRTLWTGGADRRVRRWDALAGRALGPVGEAEQAAPAAGLDQRGAQVFRACAACHALTPEGGNMAGPTLHGLFGRRMGSVPSYGYSERLARRDIVWTPATVADLFTRGPDVVTPGTTMPVQRLESAEDMAALLRFLEQATR